MVLLQIGGANRALRGTEANEASSRSHALLQLSVEVEIHQEGGSTVIRKAKLNLVGDCTALPFPHNHSPPLPFPRLSFVGMYPIPSHPIPSHPIPYHPMYSLKTTRLVGLDQFVLSYGLFV